MKIGGWFLVLILLLILSNPLTTQNNKRERLTNSTKINLSIARVSSLTNHDPIIINENDGLISQATAEGWVGDGSKSNPFIIGGYNITNSSENSIEIRDTSLHFKINNCLLNGDIQGGTYGIVFRNVYNGVIDSNNITTHSCGIYIEQSENITISTNEITNAIPNDLINYPGNVNSNLDGIKLYQSDFNFIHDNNIGNMTRGVEIDSSNNNTVENNTIRSLWQRYSYSDGIYLRISHNNTLSINKIYDDKLYGIHLILSDNNNITGNYVEIHGIQLENSNTNNIEKNNVTSTIIQDRSTHNTLIKNTVNGEIELIHSGQNKIKDNNMKSFSVSKGYPGSPIEVYYQIEVTNNIVNGKPLIYWQNISGGSVPQCGRVVLVNCTSVTVGGQDLTSGSVGITVAYCSKINISNNVLSNFSEQAIYNIFSDNTTFSNNLLKENNKYGIYSKDSNYGQIINNTVLGKHGEYGMYLDDCDYTKISWNTISNNSDYGLYVRSSWRCNIDRNVLDNNSIGIYSGISYGKISRNNITNSINNGIEIGSSNTEVYANNFSNNGGNGIYLGSNVNTIYDNIITENEGHGILTKNADENEIENNRMSNNKLDGCALEHGSSKNYIAFNMIQENKGHGIYLYSSNSNDIEGNSINSNIKHGIFLNQSSNNEISQNNFRKNNQGGTSQGRDEENDNTENTLKKNYWNEWTTPDANRDHIVDNPYPLDGTSNNFDAKPLIEPAHIIGRPIILSPNTYKWEVLSNTVTVIWKSAGDSVGHEINYSLYYSPFTWDEYSWTPFATNIQESVYKWDTTTMEDGYYRLKVVATCEEGLITESFHPGLDEAEKYVIDNHRLTEPTVIYPNRKENLTGTVIVDWTASNDSNNHDVTYSVYYAADGGISWHLLADKLVETHYQWDTTAVEDGFDYRIKIVVTCTEGLTESDFSDQSFFIQNYLVYKEHSPINIIDNSSFISQATAEGWKGDGTKASPYIIEGYYINSSSDLISIKHVDLSFEIKNCLLIGDKQNKGIYFEYVPNGLITNNRILNTKEGIFFYRSTTIPITKNRIFNNNEGIFIRQSSEFNLIDENLIYHNGMGIRFYDESDDNEIENNKIYNNSFNGICLSYSDFNSIKNNIIRNNYIEGDSWGWGVNNYPAGISMIGSCSNSISHNNLSSNGLSGIYLYDSHDNTISWNQIENNGEDGVYVRSYCRGNKIVSNIINNNYDSGIKRRTQEHNEFSHNYLNGNGCGITSYLRGGAATIWNNTISNSINKGMYISAGHIIRGNTFINNSIYLSGEKLEDCLQEEVSNNIVNNKPLIFWQNITGKTLSAEAGQVILLNCQSVTVTDQNVSNATFGLYSLYCSDIKVWNSKFSNNSQHGMYLRDCNGITIQNTIVSYNIRDGISLLRCNTVEISYNTFTNNRFGVYLWDSTDCQISCNIITGNMNSGIDLDNSQNNSIKYNLVQRNGGGLSLYSSSNQIIMYNLVANNTGRGIHLYDSGNNTVAWNNFINHSIIYPVYSQAIDTYPPIANNFTHNFWSDWQSPDNDTNGYVDYPYNIYSDAETQDPKSLVQAVHILVEPVVVYPTIGITLYGTVTIQWHPSVDTLDHPISYDIYYSHDNRNSWIVIATNVYTTECHWDTSTVADGTTYLVKVVAVCTEGKTVESQPSNQFTINNTSPPTDTTTTTTTTTPGTGTEITTRTTVSSPTTSHEPKLTSQGIAGFTFLTLMWILIPFIFLRRRKALN